MINRFHTTPMKVTPSDGKFMYDSFINDTLRDWSRAHAAILKAFFSDNFFTLTGAMNKYQPVVERIYKDLGKTTPHIIRMSRSLQHLAKIFKIYYKFSFTEINGKLCRESSTDIKNFLQKLVIDKVAKVHTSKNHLNQTFVKWSFPKPSYITQPRIQYISYLLDGIEDALEIVRIPPDNLPRYSFNNLIIS
jgi:hypothetical protein